MTEIIAYTDGACSGNPGPGGWGVYLIAQQNGRRVKEREIKGGERLTTNNRMELQAAIEALAVLTKPARITVRTDSKYLRNGITSWIQNWKQNGWQTSSRQPVKNGDQWKRLDSLCAYHDVTWQWVKGHAEEQGNEKADHLARSGMQPYK